MEKYKIYAIEYERRQATSYDMFVRPTEIIDLEMNYYIWAIVGSEATVVVDCGYTKETAQTRGREIKTEIGNCLELIDLDPAQIEHVILTHAHWDHIGNLNLFPNATFYIQATEVAFWNGPFVKYPIIKEVAEEADLAALARLNMAGQVIQLDGSEEILPGIKLHLTGGHTPGSQIVEVDTAKGTAVIASDAVKSYKSLELNWPDPYGHNIMEAIAGFELVRSLTTDEKMIFPGHDPAVLEKLPSAGPSVAVLE